VGFDYVVEGKIMCAPKGSLGGNQAIIDWGHDDCAPWGGVTMPNVLLAVRFPLECAVRSILILRSVWIQQGFQCHFNSDLIEAFRIMIFYYPNATGIEPLKSLWFLR